MKKAKEDILLVGTGNMGIEYAKVLKAMQYAFVVVGRGEKSASHFSKTIGIPVALGGIEKWLNENKSSSKIAIVAVNGNTLGLVTIALFKSGFKLILLEKPGGLDFKEIGSIAKQARDCEAEVFVAYNRRFYASVKKARDIIKKDGGVSSFFFEFTEWSHIISQLPLSSKIKKEWFLHNSTHILDLAFFLGGKPKEITTYAAGGLLWHPRASVFAGAGISENGALFSYHANWDAPGRWGVEMFTQKHRLILRPLEKLQIQRLGNLKINPVDISDDIDMQFKPGLYKQVEAFLTTKKHLCSIEQHHRNCMIYKKFLVTSKY